MNLVLTINLGTTTWPLRCPAMDECSGELSDACISQTVQGRDILCVQQHRRSIDLVCTALSQDVSDSDPMFIRLKYINKDGTFDALQCSKCHFGPIEHTRCDDLREFHHKQGVTNRCPRCNHFESLASKFPSWNGIVS